MDTSRSSYARPGRVGIQFGAMLLLLLAHLRPAFAGDESPEKASSNAWLAVTLHNAVPIHTQELVTVTLYDVVVAMDRPNRNALVASEHEFRFGSWDEQRQTPVHIPAALESPRARIFGGEEDRDDDPMQMAMPSWDAADQANWGWLERDVNRSLESRDRMQIRNDALMQERLLMQSMGLESAMPGVALPAVTPSPLLNTSREDPFGARESSGLLGRELLRPNR